MRVDASSTVHSGRKDIRRDYKALSNMLELGQTNNGFVDRLKDFLSRSPKTPKEQTMIDDLRERAKAKGIAPENKTEFRAELDQHISRMEMTLDQLKALPRALNENGVTLQEASTFYEDNSTRLAEAKQTYKALEVARNGQPETRFEQRLREKYEDTVRAFETGLNNLNKAIAREAEKHQRWAHEEYQIAV